MYRLQWWYNPSVVAAVDFDPIMPSLLQEALRTYPSYTPRPFMAVVLSHTVFPSFKRWESSELAQKQHTAAARSDYINKKVTNFTVTAACLLCLGVTTIVLKGMRTQCMYINFRIPRLHAIRIMKSFCQAALTTACTT